MGALSVNPSVEAGDRQARKRLSTRLQARRAEVEEALLTRVYAIADPVEIADPEYAAGLKRAVGDALEYGVAALDRGDERSFPIPATLLAQAGLAARNGVSLDTVLRRYFAGYTLLAGFLAQEVENDPDMGGQRLTRLLQTQAILFDRLVVAVTEEYARECRRRVTSREERRVRHVKRLLDGEPLDTTSLAYDFELWHVGVIAVGEGTSRGLRELAEGMDRTLLVVTPAERTAWAWLGGRRSVPTADIKARVESTWPEGSVFVLGEPGPGLAGWRLTHKQAAAALRIAQHGAEGVARYADVALTATALQDEVLVSSMRQLYLDPLSEAPDGGETLRETIRAYLATGFNVSSTAAALGVDRRTVTRRVRTVEEILGRPFEACAADLEVALRLDGLSPTGAQAGTAE